MNKRKVYPIIIFSIFFLTFRQHSILVSSNPLQESRFKSYLIFHDPISIVSDNQFALLGFPGSGTEIDPYRIEGLNITSSEQNLISISGTTVYFVIANNSLNGMFNSVNCIQFTNVINGVIKNSTLINCKNGFYSINSENNTISDNKIYKNHQGISIEKGKNNSLSNNEVFDNEMAGIFLNDAPRTIITHNTIYRNSQQGIFIYYDSDHSLIRNNTIYDNLASGINTASTNFITIVNNTLYQNNNGVLLESKSNYFYIANNTLLYNGFIDGLQILGNSNHNIIENNNMGEGKAVDQGINNTFINNRWGGLITPDRVPNQIITLLLLAFIIFTLGIYLYRSKRKEIPNFIEFIQTSQYDFLKSLYHKVIIGLENVKAELIANSNEISGQLDLMHQGISSYFPEDFRYELKSELKGRSVLVLIEIAYQTPTKTNPAYLAKILEVTPPTLTKELKKLLKLKYIQPYISKKVLQDSRFRNYVITSKGIALLQVLKDNLKIVIQRVDESDLYESQSVFS